MGARDESALFLRRFADRMPPIRLEEMRARGKAENKHGTPRRTASCTTARRRSFGRSSRKPRTPEVSTSGPWSGPPMPAACSSSWAGWATTACSG